MANFNKETWEYLDGDFAKEFEDEFMKKPKTLGCTDAKVYLFCKFLF